MHKSFKTYPDSVLLSLIEQGEQAATEELYLRYSKPLLSFLMKLTSNDYQLSNDILQEVFIKVIRNADKYKDSHKVSTWLFSIASNTWKNEVKSNTKLTPLTQDILLESEDELEAIPLDRAIAQLSPEHKEVVILKYQQGFQIDEMASILDLPAGTIKSRLFYALKKLNKILTSCTTL